MLKISLLCLMVLATYAKPQDSPTSDTTTSPEASPLSSPHPKSQPSREANSASTSDTGTPIPIISYAESYGETGNFNFSYETANGIQFEQSGYTKNVVDVVNQASGATNDEGNGVIQVMTGSFSYVAPDGTKISLRYIADENGFQPEGDHLPTPSPIPDAIQKLLEMLPGYEDNTNEIKSVNENGNVPGNKLTNEASNDKEPKEVLNRNGHKNGNGSGKNYQIPNTVTEPPEP